MRISSVIRALCGAPIVILAVIGLESAGVPAQAASTSAAWPADYRVEAAMVLNVRRDELITIKRIDGRGNCVKDETSKMVEAKTPRIVEQFGFTAKDSGSCSIEPSHSILSTASGAPVRARTWSAGGRPGSRWR
jgi:hypothetical protein